MRSRNQSVRAAKAGSAQVTYLAGLGAVALAGLGGFAAFGDGLRSSIAGEASGATAFARIDGPHASAPGGAAPAVSAEAFMGAAAIKKLLETAENVPEELRREVPMVENEFFIPPDRIPNARLSDVAGIDEILRDVWEVAVMPFQKPDIYAGTALPAQKGVLLEGPPGVGKTQIARSLANLLSQYGVAFFDVDTAQLAGDIVKGPARIAELFETARQQPSIIYLDEFDAIAKERGKGAVSDNALTTLLRELDGMGDDNQLVVLASTNLAGALDEAIKRPGRFDRVISVPVPNAEGRNTLLELFSRTLPLRVDVDFAELVERTAGFTGADIRGVVQESRLRALRRSEYDGLFEITPDDFHYAIDEFNPTVARTDLAKATPVKWEDIGGLGHVIERLVDGVDEPWRNPERFTAVGEKATPMNFLMYGPPGTGKTMLAQAVAGEIDAPVFVVSGADVRTMWYGESARNLKKILQKAARSERAVVYFDEAESLFPVRGKGLGNNENDTVVNELLQFMDGAKKNPNVAVLFGTNRPELIDEAVLSRIDEMLYVGAPDVVGRRQILDTYVKGRAIAVDDPIAFLNELAQRTEGFSGRDLARLVKKAARRSATHGDPERLGMTREAFEWALAETRPSVSKEMEADYRRMGEEIANRKR